MSSSPTKDQTRAPCTGSVESWQLDWPPAKSLRDIDFIGSFFLNYLSIYFWLCWIFIALCGLSPVAESEGYSLLVVHGLTAVASPVRGSRAHRLQHLWCTGSVTQQPVGSAWTRGWTGIPCISGRIPNHLTTRKASLLAFFKFHSPINS